MSLFIRSRLPAWVKSGGPEEDAEPEPLGGTEDGGPLSDGAGSGAAWLLPGWAPLSERRPLRITSRLFAKHQKSYWAVLSMWPRFWSR